MKQGRQVATKELKEQKIGKNGSLMKPLLAEKGIFSEIGILGVLKGKRRTDSLCTAPKLFALTLNPSWSPSLFICMYKHTRKARITWVCTYIHTYLTIF
jgi:hypothetical protein